MKKLLIILCLSGFILSSCSNDFKYSCDPDIEMWVKENMAELQKMEWDDIIQIPDANYQRAAYGIFTVEQKINMWNSKISDLLNLDWSDLEKAHILKLQEIINEHGAWFETRNGKTKKVVETIEDEIILITYKWIDYCYGVLKWDKNTIAAIAATPQKVLSKTGGLFLPDGIATRGGVVINPGRPGTNPSCDCAVKSDYCMGSENCTETTCDEPANENCGFLLLYRCKGLCK